MIPSRLVLVLFLFALTFLLASSVPAFAGSSLRSKIVRFNSCTFGPPCIGEFHLNGRFDRTGEKDYFRFYNDRGATELDLWVTELTNGSLPSGNGVRVVA